MKIRFYNAKILSMTGIHPYKITEGEVHTNGSQISFVGKPDKQNTRVDTQFDCEIDCHGNLLMPSFKNAHTHSAMTFLRSYADDLPLQEWLFHKVFPLEARLNDECVYAFTKLAVLEYLTSGITASFDMYFNLDAYVRAHKDMGFRTVICGSINDFGPSVEQLEQDFLHYRNYSPLVTYQLGFHAEYTTSEGLLKDISALAHKYRTPVFTHNSETQREADECVERHGATPTVYLDSLGMFDFGGGGFHCVYMSEQDMKIFAEKGLYAVTNPGSNTKLASGIAPVCEFLARGIPVAIGTDGAASNNCLDFFREMFLVTGLQKLLQKDAAACPADKVLEMACVTGAHCMGLSDCDALAAGKQADLILIDLHQPNMQPEHNLVKNLVYSGSKQNVKLTMVAGKILYENGEFFVGEAPEEIYARANRMVRALLTENSLQT